MIDRQAGRLTAVGMALFVLAGCAIGKTSTSSKLPVPDAVASLIDSRGADRGHVNFFRETNGLRLEVVARGFGAGTYGMHLHEVGRCDGPKFATAGSHWNPMAAQHGRDNPMGAHLGDLPNLVIEPETIGRATVQLIGARLAGDGALLDADGAAFVIHAQADDMKTDPSGNSGDRIACGVVRPSS